MAVTNRLAARVSELTHAHARVLVGVDGPDAAGKTTLADALRDACRALSPATTVLRATVDAFHHPRAQRYARGELSPEGCYHDSFDYPTMLATCLLPFTRGDHRIRLGHHDHRSDEPADTHATAVPGRAILIVDGVFLLRPQLRSLWTFTVHLRISPEETVRRAHQRDGDLFGGAEEIERRYRDRYLPAQQLYQRDADPQSHAHVLIDNSDPLHPCIERWPS